MVVHGSIKILSIRWMSLSIILRALDVKVRDPPQLAINISILRNIRIVRHSGSFDFVHFIRVILSSWFDQNRLLRLELFVEVLPVMGVISIIE